MSFLVEEMLLKYINVDLIYKKNENQYLRTLSEETKYKATKKAIKKL